MIEYERTVDGIGCTGCEQLIERTLEKRTVVSSAAADADTGTVAVTPVPVSAAELIGTVLSIGYTVCDHDVSLSRRLPTRESHSKCSGRHRRARGRTQRPRPYLLDGKV